MTTHLLRSVAELEALNTEWQALFLADPASTPFQHPAWLLPWWRHLGEGTLAAVIVRDATGTLLGLLPAYIYMQPETCRRDLLLLGAGTSDYLGGLFSQPAAAALALSTLLQLPEWEFADLHQLRADSPLLAAARDRSLAPTESEPCAVTQTDPAARPSKIRLNINRYRHRAEPRGSLRLSAATTPAEALAHLETLIALHTRRWQERGESGVLATPAIQQQHRQAVPLLLATGLLRMVALYLDPPDQPDQPVEPDQPPQPIAILYGLVDPIRQSGPPRRFYAYLIGIDPALAEISPGTLLLAALIEQCAAEGIQLFDMLRGGETYKRLWGAQPELTFAVRQPRA